MTAPGECAAQYARAGLPVLPLHWPTAAGCSCRHPECKNVGKHPLAGLVPHGKDDATTDVEVVGDWWTRCPAANIGVRPPVGIVVLDVDPRNGGEDTLRQLVERHGALPETLTCRTGSGGLHVWLSYGGKARGRLAAGIDVKTNAGYLVAPPSLHATGGRYEWVHQGRTAPAPQWVRDLLVPPKVSPMGNRPKGCGGTAEGALGWLARQGEGYRNHALWWVACVSLESGERDLTAVREVAESIGLDRCEIEKTLASACKRVLGAA